MGAFLHDVGKTKVDVGILNKPGKLDAREWEEMRAHTVAGDEIVAELGFPYDIRAIVRSHHERWDGTGYPDRLAGEQIPLNARILCVADVYDALTTSRSYRAELPVEEARSIMVELSGAAFDPSLLDVFLRILSERDTSHPAPASVCAA
jgi:HD-GYP domain-containing protein (c-di-GMP phosphodiesterase class II)